MICLDPDERFSALDCLKHPWLMSGAKDIDLDWKIIQRSMKFTGKSVLKRGAFHLLVKGIDPG